MVTLAGGLLAPAAACAAEAGMATNSPPVVLSAEQDHQRVMDELGMTNFRRRLTDSYDESIANPYPDLPDPLTLKNGTKVTTAQMWWDKRRPEIVEDYEREFYGRVPANVPAVKWEVTSTTNRNLTNGTGDNATVFPVIVKTLLGHVDNSSYTNISVNIQFSYTIPANAAGPFSRSSLCLPLGVARVDLAAASGSLPGRSWRRHQRPRRNERPGIWRRWRVRPRRICRWAGWNERAGHKWFCGLWWN